MTKLSNKNAIITGGASGMGFQMAKLFSQQGARIVIIDIDHEQLDSALEQLKRINLPATGYQVDITNEKSISIAFERIAIDFGGCIHILINNAGVAEFGSVEETSLGSWEKIMAVNATGSFLCSKAALPHMKRKGGSVVNFASVAGMVGIPKMAAYCAAKAAVIGLTKQMAAEYSAQGIRVNCLCPGTTADTGMGRQILGTDSSPETQAKRLAKYPIGRFGKPEEIAQAALFLASDDASFVTGAALSVDGGMTAI